MPEDHDELVRENDLLRALLEAATELVDVLAADGTLMHTFRKRDRPLGYEPEDIVGQNVFELIHPEDASKARSALIRVGGVPGSSLEVQLRLRKKDGGWMVADCLAENRLDDPAVHGIVVCSRDVTRRVELEEKLRLSQRTESVGRLASGIVHDFNNLLAVIQLAATQAQRSGSASALESINQAATRGASLTKRLLSFVRGRPTQRRIIDLAATLHEIESTLSSLLPEDVALEVKTTPGPLPVSADPTEIEHVVLNLVLNARDAMPGGGRITVSTSRTESSEAQIVVSDDGSGMADAVRERAFEPFFTTKDVERGTGLGLWAVRDMVQACGGTIELDTAQGRGTRAVVKVPIADRLPSTPPPPASSRGARSREILLVEDQPHLRRLLAEALRLAGHSVTEAGDGAEALEILERHAKEPEALVTDIHMPRVSGPELAKKLRARYPELLVVFATGYDDPGEAWVDDRAEILNKPFSGDELIAVVHRLSKVVLGSR